MMNSLRVRVCFCLLFVSHLCYSQVWFQDVSTPAGIDHFTRGSDNLFVGPMNGGTCWFDIDNDGWDDLYLTGGTVGDKCFRNNGDGSFEDITVSSGVQSIAAAIPTVGVAAGDVDRNGYEDLIVTTEEGYESLLLMNFGNGTFIEQAVQRGIIHTGFSAGVALGDYDQDGWIDIYFSNWRDFSINPPFESGHPDNLYRNVGNGNFSDVTNGFGISSSAGCGLAVVFSDYDLDGDSDILLGNDFGDFEWADGNRLFQNDEATFTDQSVSSSFLRSINSMGIATGDYDEDQDFDYYITNINSNILLRNDSGVYSDQAENAGVTSQWTVIDTTGLQEYELIESWSWGTMFFDYDNDTYIDLFVSNGVYQSLLAEDEPDSVDENRLYRNLDAAGIFEDVSVITGMNDGGTFRGCAKSDFDRDGDLDIVLVQLDSLGGSKRTVLMQNEGGNQKNWIQFELNGVTSNLDAIGSVVKLYVDGRIFLRELDSGGGSYLSHHSKVIHFGLNNYNNIDSVQVVWPNGNTDSYFDLDVNQRVSIYENDDLLVGIPSIEIPAPLCYPNPATEILRFTGLTPNLNPSSYRITCLSSGKVVKVDGFEELITVTDLENGLYLIELVYNGGLNESLVNRVKFAVSR